MIRALYGGSFDPVHAGHVALVEAVLERGLADRVHVVPARQSPFKPEETGATAADRLRLVELAFAASTGVTVDARELGRDGPSYTITTLTELMDEHPRDTWRLVVGADNVADFHRWREPDRLLELARPLVVARGTVDQGSVALVPPLAGRADVLPDFDHPASATDIRRDLAAGVLPARDLLPTVVAAAITSAGLYGWPGPSAGPAPGPTRKESP